MHPLSVGVLVMAGVTAYVGLYHVFVYVRRRQHRRDLSFALLCLVIVGYDIACAGLYNVDSVAAGIRWQYAQTISLVLGSAAFLLFTVHYTEQTSRRVVGAMMIYMLATAVFVAFDRSGLVWDESQPLIKHVSLPYGRDVTYYEATAGPLILLQSFMGVVVFGYAAWAGVQLYRSGGRREARPLLAALLIFFLGIFNDSAVSIGLYSFVYTLEYAYMSVIVLMAYGLSDELVQASSMRTRLRESEELLRQAQKMEALGTLAGGIAHDFNNLLSPILGHAELARERVEPDSEIAEDLDVISSAGMRAAQLTRQLLGVSRKQVAETRVIDLNQIVDEFRPVLRHLVRENIEIESQLADGPCTTVADPGQMHQILMNLAVNASDAMPEGGTLGIETARVTLDASAAAPLDVEPGAYVCLAVRDTGLGMSLETARRVFEPFYTTKERGRGTGLGLSTVRGITASHGGGLAAKSIEGQGSRFEIYLQATDREVEPAPATEARSDARGHETILIAEDEPAVRNLAERVLARRGYEVLAPSTPEEALELVRSREGRIDLLLSDVIMPRLGGRQLYERAAELRPGLRVLFMSGYAGDEIDATATTVGGGLHFLQKPFTVDELVRRVREVLDG